MLPFLLTRLATRLTGQNVSDGNFSFAKIIFESSFFFFCSNRRRMRFLNLAEDFSFSFWKRSIMDRRVVLSVCRCRRGYLPECINDEKNYYVYVTRCIPCVDSRWKISRDISGMIYTELTCSVY